MTTSIIALADIHSNSTVAVACPQVYGMDGVISQPSDSVKALYDCWLELQDIIKEERKYADILIGASNGDAVDKDAKSRNYQWYTQADTLIVNNAVNLIKPVWDLCDCHYYILGTIAHSGKSGDNEMELAERTDGVVNPATGLRLWGVLPLIIEGIKIQFSHWRSTARKPWTTPGLAERYAAETLLNFAKQREEPPDIVFRAHGHKWDDSKDKYPLRVIFQRAWQLSTEFTNTIAQNTTADIGATIIRCDARKYEIIDIPFVVKESKFIWQIPPLKQKQNFRLPKIF